MTFEILIMSVVSSNLISDISHCITGSFELTCRWSVYKFAFGLDEKEKGAIQRVHKSFCLKGKCANIMSYVMSCVWTLVDFDFRSQNGIKTIK